MNRRFEFIVGGVRVHPSSVWVIGRLSEGPLALNDVFTEVFRHVPAACEEDYGRLPDVEEGSRRSVSLSLTYIEAYRRSLFALDRGMTALLVLEGESLPLIQENEVLAGYSSTDIPAEYVKARLSASIW
jgi:hypothetical protein